MRRRLTDRWSTAAVRSPASQLPADPLNDQLWTKERKAALRILLEAYLADFGGRFDALHDGILSSWPAVAALAASGASAGLHFVG